MKTYNKFKEYIWLVNTIRKAKRISLVEINDLWLDTEMSEGIELSRSTFNRNKDAIEDIFGIFIDCDRNNGYKYYIGNESVLHEDTIQNWLLSTLTVSNIVSEGVSIQDRILLETPPDNEYLPKIIEAMKRSVRIKISYLRYGAEELKTFDFEPYCIKLFQKRWYVLAHFYRPATEEKEEADYMGMFAFDRIQKLELTNVKFEIDPDFDAAEYFADCFGVFVHDGTEIEKVVIRAFDPQPYYLRDVPLHHSQKEMVLEEGSVYFEYRLRPTKDFCNHLLSLGNTIKVISPEWLAEEIRNMHLEAASLYD